MWWVVLRYDSIVFYHNKNGTVFLKKTEFINTKQCFSEFQSNKIFVRLWLFSCWSWCSLFCLTLRVFFVFFVFCFVLINSVFFFCSIEKSVTKWLQFNYCICFRIAIFNGGICTIQHPSLTDFWPRTTVFTFHPSCWIICPFYW